ncbi:hypothetical protein RI129_005613 [Pyrocoelia pectoralis]|uniref:Ankyrin repeat protein n=1 Tax=Pyrocoelia pectoralis TaxID=417401 RepID=A0AAN7VFH4_9COLE
MDSFTTHNKKIEKYQFLELLLLRCLQQDKFNFNIISHDDNNFHLILEDTEDISVITFHLLVEPRCIREEDFNEEGEFSLNKCLESISFLQNAYTKVNYFIFTNCSMEKFKFAKPHDDKFNFLNFTNLRNIVTGSEGEFNIFIDRVPSDLYLSITEALQQFTSHYNIKSVRFQYILERFYNYIKQTKNFNKDDVQFSLLELFLWKYKVDLTYDISEQKCNSFWSDITGDKLQVVVQSNVVTDSFLKAHTAGVIANFGDASDLAYRKLWLEGKVSLLTFVLTSDDFNDVVSILKAFSAKLRVTILTVPNCDTTFNLESDRLSQLLNCKVNLQGKSLVELRQFMDEAALGSLQSSDVISLITNNFVMDYCYKKLPSYFIERSFLKVILRLDVVNDLRNEAFVVKNELDGVNLPLRTLEGLSNVFVVEGNERDAIAKAREEGNRPVHFVVSQGENWFEWGGSWGSVDNLKKFDVSQEYGLTCNFTHLVSDKRSVRILVVDSSTGKSTLLDHIALNLPDVWVLTVSLKRYISSHKPNAILDYLYQTQDGQSELTRKIFSQFVNMKKIHILLDHYDEVVHNYFNEVIEIITCLRENNFNVWITVSPNNSAQLEESVSTIATFTKPFTVQNQHEFLVKYFHQFCHPNKDIDEFVKTLTKVIRTKVDAFLDSPLYLMFIADIYTEEFKHFCVTGGLRLEHDFVLLKFFDAFLARYINYLSDKYNFSNAKILAHLSMMAFQRVFNENDLKTFDSLKDDVLQELTIENFPHPILIYYLIAKWMSENLSNNLVKRFHKKRFDNMDNYSDVFKFFDLMLAQNLPLHTSLIQGKINQITSILPHLFNETDTGGRNVVHIAALYGLPHPKTHTIRNIDTDDNFVNIIRLADVKTIEACDTLLGYSTLEYAINSGCLAVANAICEKVPHIMNNAFVDFKQLENYIEYCLQINNYKHLFKTLLKYIVCLRVTTDKLRENSRMDIVSSLLHLNEVTEQNFQNYLTIYDVQILSHLMEKLDLKKEGVHYFTNLHIASAFGNKQNILDLLKEGAKINNLGNGSYTPLHAAVINKRMDNVETLLMARAKINIVDVFGNTALHLACQNVDTPLVRLLMKKGADISIQNNEGDTPFHHALKNQSERSAELFLPDKYYSLFFSPQTSISRDRCLDVNMQNKNGDTPLLLALQHNCPYIVRELLEYHADVHIVNKTGNSCLHYAAEANDYKTTLELIYYRVNLNCINEEGETPLLVALRCRYVRTARLLLSKGARVGDVTKTGRSCLHYVAQYGLKDMVINILDKGADINKQNEEGQTPLMLAVTSQRANVVVLLLSRGADPNILDNRGCNALHHAADYTLRNVVKHLITYGCSVNQVNNDGDTALIVAIRCGIASTIHYLLSNGADVNVTDGSGASCLHHAVTFPTLIEDLLKLGLDINKEDNNGNTPLMVAIERQSDLMIKLLITNGADIFTENKSGFSPIHYAAQYALDDLLNELISKGADINKRTHAGGTPLSLHIQHWYTRRSTTKILLDKGADVSIVDNQTGNSLLHFAAEKGNDDILEVLLSTSMDINSRNNEGDTPLHLSIKRGYTSAAELILTKGADPNIADGRNNTCLHSAVTGGAEDLVKSLLKHGANANAANNDNETPITRAQRSGHLSIVTLLLTNTSTDDNYIPVFSSVRNGEFHALKKHINDGFDINKQDGDGNTPLLLALKNRQVGIVDYLLSKEVDVTIPNNRGVTCLHHAVELGDAKIVRELLAKGCDIDVVSVNGDSSLLLAISSTNFHIAHLLLDRNAKTDTVPLNNEQGSCLHSACRYGSHDIVLQILQNGFDVNQFSRSGTTPLMHSLTNNHRRIAITLIESGADVNLTTEWGWSCLSAAVDLQYLDVINLLLDKGAYIDYLDNSSTSLKYAITNEKRASVQLLLSRGADVYLGDEWTGYPLHFAAQNEMDDVVSFILEEGFDVNKTTKFYDTAVYVSASRKNFTTTKLLIAKGACIDNLNDNFNSFLGVAAQNGWEELVEELIKNGADIHHENDDHYTPLRSALEQGHVNVVKLIFAEIISQGWKDCHLNYLHAAVEFGDNKIVTALLDNGYDINKLNSNGETPLLLALKKERLCTARLLLVKGANYNVRGDVAESCLYYFAQYAWNDMVLKMLEEGCDVNIKHTDGATPLYVATQYKHLSTIQLLLSHGADPLIRTSYSLTPLCQSVQNNCKHMLKAFLDGIDPNKGVKDITSALFLSLDYKHFELSDILINYNIDNSENESGETMLFVAVKNCYINLVRQLLTKYGSVINEVNSDGNSILISAVENGNVDLIKLLLEKGADPNIANKKGNSCLHYAVRGSEEILLLFLECSDIDLKNSDGLTPLLYALEEAYTHSAQLLIAFGSNIYVEDPMGNNCLHYAVKVGAEELVKYLIEAGLDIHKKNIEGDDCLDLAMNKGYVDIMKLLVSQGADVHQVNRFGENCLLKAVEENNDFVSDLLEKGVNVNQQCNRGYTPFVMALDKANTEHAKMLLANNADVSIRNRCGSNLHYAIYQKVDIIAELLDLGLDIDEQDDQGDTPLLLALQSEMEDTVKLLLERGASVHIRNKNYNCCLHNAINLPNVELLSAMIAKGADVNCRNWSEETPLLKALKAEKLEYAKILLENGAQCDVIDNENGSCLFYAAKFGFDDLVSDFISKGVSIDQPHSEGNAFLVALKNKHASTVKLLIENGADIHYRTSYSVWLDLLIPLNDVEVFDMLLAKGIDINYRLSRSEPLIITALVENSKTMVDFLIAKGANVHLTSYETGASCLHYASSAGYDDIVNDLLDKGLDINRENNQNETPLRLAFIGKHSSTIKLLLSRGASVDDGNFTHTYMHYAAELGDDSIVTDLIHKKVDLNTINSDGNTPLFLAVLFKNVSAVRLLIENGADYNLKNRENRNLLQVAKSVEAEDLIIDFLNLGLKDEGLE